MSPKTLLGIAGRAGAGKTTLQEIITALLGDVNNVHRPESMTWLRVCPITLAGPIKRAASALLGSYCDNSALYGTSEERNAGLGVPGLEHVTYRSLLQRFGDVGRDLDPGFYAKITSSRILKLFGAGVDAVIVGDVRFGNEADMIHELGGVVVLKEGGSGSGSEHKSENKLHEVAADFSVPFVLDREDRDYKADLEEYATNLLIKIGLF